MSSAPLPAADVTLQDATTASTTASTTAPTATPQEPAPAFKPLSLKSNFVWTFIGHVVYAGCQWAMLVVLARLASPEVVGRFALALAVTAPIIIFAGLQLRNIQATDAQHRYRFSDYFSLRIVAIMLALAAIAGAALASGYAWETAVVVMAVGVAKAVEAIADVFYGLFQKHERFDWMSKSMMYRGFLSVFALAGGLVLTAQLLWGVVGVAASWALVLVLYDYRNARAIVRDSATRASHPDQGPDGVRFHFDMTTQRKLLAVTLPLGFVGFLISVNPNIPRYLIEHLFGEHDLGIYSAIVYLISLTGIVNSLWQAAGPRLAKYAAAGRVKQFVSLLLRLCGLAALLGVAGIAVAGVAGTPILMILYGSEYSARADVLFWTAVTAAAAYLAACLTYAIIALRQTHTLLPMYAIVTVATGLAAVWLVPNYGILGGSWAIAVSGTLQVIIAAAINARTLRRLATSSINLSA